MNYAIISITALLAAGGVAYGIFNKKKRCDGLIIKILSIALFAIFAIRFLSYNSGLDKLSLYVIPSDDSLVLPADKGRAVLAFFVEWTSLAFAMLICLKQFFAIKTVDRLTLFVAPLYLLLAIIGANAIAEYSFGSAAGKVTFSTVMFAIEVGLSIAIVAYHWYNAIKDKKIPLIRSWKKEWKDIVYFLLGLVLILVVSLPNFWYTFLINKNRLTVAYAKEFLFYHRVLLYGAMLLPIIAYFILRNKEKHVTKFILLYFSLVAMFLYCYQINFTKLVEDPTSWPLHLCNTAMFLVPLCIVFKTKKLFYFTYFINVFGALAAMLMPNYNDGVRLFSSHAIRFWYNHYCAFFMPLLMVALHMFDRPTIKQFRYSIVGFCMYFIVALLMNVIFRGFGYEPDYFFLAGDHIATTLGNWAEKIYDKTLILSIGGREFLFRPLYQGLFFAIYVLLGLAMWFIYELGFSLADASGALTERRKKIKQDQIALMSVLGDGRIEEPMNKDAGIKLELKHFSKRYATSKHYAVNDANLVVNGGEIFGFLGPNGAGKSTIIKSIVGIQPITEGAIEVCGYDCEKQPVQAKRVIGYVPDHYALYEKLTGREYINYIADIYEVSQEERTERIEKHIKMFELEGSIDNPIKTYSHGMKQKITIMAALVHDPKLWILDEPLTGLDPNSIHQVKECMKEHAAKGNIVFFSSHIIDVVERICDKITIIKKGQIQVTKTVEEIEKEGPLEEFYLKIIGGESAQQ